MLVLKPSCMVKPFRTIIYSKLDHILIQGVPRSLSDLGNQEQKAVERGQIVTISLAHRGAMAQESGERLNAETLLQLIYPKSDRLLPFG